MTVMTPDGKIHNLLNEKDLEGLILEYMGTEVLDATVSFARSKAEGEFDEAYKDISEEVERVEEQYQRELHDVVEELEAIEEELSHTRVLKSKLLTMIGNLKGDILKNL